jgi:hypothetical protein
MTGPNTQPSYSGIAKAVYMPPFSPRNLAAHLHSMHQTNAAETAKSAASDNPYLSDKGVSNFPPLPSDSVQHLVRQMRAPPTSLSAGQVLQSFQVNYHRLGQRTKELYSFTVVLFTQGPNLIVILLRIAMGKR